MTPIYDARADRVRWLRQEARQAEADLQVLVNVLAQRRWFREDHTPSYEEIAQVKRLEDV